MELDAKVAVDLIDAQFMDNIKPIALIIDCRKLYRDFQGIQMKHMYRELNGVADRLARLARIREVEDNILFYFNLLWLHPIFC